MVGQRNQYQRYRAYVEEGIDELIERLYNKVNIAAILGKRDFRDDLLKNKEQLKVNVELSQRLSERPTMASIIEAVAKTCKVTGSSIQGRKAGRQRANLPRKMAIYCCQQYGDYPLSSLSKAFGYTHSNSVSTAINTIKKKRENGEMKKQFKSIEKQIGVIK